MKKAIIITLSVLFLFISGFFAANAQSYIGLPPDYVPEV